MTEFFNNIINSIKNFFIMIWNALLSFLGTFLPDGVDLAFAIVLVVGIVLILFRVIIIKSSND